MSVARTPTVSQLRAFVWDVVQRHRQKQDRQRQRGEEVDTRWPFIALRAPSAWSGPSKLSIREGVTATVVGCGSPMEIATAVVRHESAGGPLLVLTDIDDLPDEAWARFFGRRRQTPDQWEIAKSLFGAQELDPRLREEPWIAEALIDAAPPTGFPSLPSRVLDEDTAWRCLLRERLAMPASRPSITELIEWAAEGTGTTLFAAEPSSHREGIARRIEESAGPAGSALLQVAARGRGSDVVPLGLVLGVLHHSDAPTAVAHAAGRFEGKHIDAPPGFDGGAARRWADAATAHLRSVLARGETKRALGWIDRAEELLEEASARELAHLSDALRLGRSQRLERFAAAVEANVQGSGTPEQLADLLLPIRTHALTSEKDPLLRALEMAVRIAAWLRARQKPDGAPSLRDAVERYAAEGGFLDWARRVVAERVEEPLVGNALTKLLAMADDWRERENERFGALLAVEGPGWRTSGGVVPIERVLSEVVAPLAADMAVLLLVMDGMGMDVFREVLESLAEDAWVEWTPRPGQTRRRVLAAFPTVTNVCRASLFAGEITEGGSAQERKTFAAHPDLVRSCKPKSPPRVFHKGDLAPGEEDEDTEYLRSVASKDDRVVAVVLNAVDDHLDSGGQFRHEWTRTTIKRLDRILDAARDADRVIVMTSDHGHVLGRTTEKVGSDELGERYRVAEAARKGEVVVKGPRVRAATGNTVVLPWSELIRYANQKHGFHGGAAPQEAVVPLAILRASEYVEDEAQVLHVEEPAWWTPREKVAAATAVPPVVEPVVPAATSVPAAGQGLLFDTRPHWLERCLRTKRYQDNVKLAGRRVPDEDRVRAILAAIDAQGGQTTRKALSLVVEIQELRLRGMLPILQRILNVEGYQVLVVNDDADIVRLDRDLLERQFGEE